MNIQSTSGKRFRKFPVNGHFQIKFSHSQVNNVSHSENRRVLFGQNHRVLGSNTETHNRSHVTKYRFANLLIELTDILMSDGQTQTILTRFGQNFRKRVRGEVLKFVDVKVKIFTDQK